MNDQSFASSVPSQPVYARLDDRAVLRIDGDDRVEFLQGLVSNDVQKATGERAIYAAFLTAQGKYLHDFFVVGDGDALLLDCEGARADDLKRRLSMYKLRSDVSIERASGIGVAVAFGRGAADAFGLPDVPGAATALDGGVAFVDPRLAEAGVRLMAPSDNAEGLIATRGLDPADPSEYDRYRMALGLPDGSRDLIPEKSTLLENGFDELGGVDWDKGCFLGQELTARTRYRGLTKKRLMPVSIEGKAPVTGDIVRLDGKDAGEIRSIRDGLGLALLRLDALDKWQAGAHSLFAGDAKVVPHPQSWMTLGESTEK